jgi:glutamate carboxypeptidase
VLIIMVLEALKEFHPEVFENTHWLVALNASEEALSSDVTSQLVQRLPERVSACLVFEGGTPSANAVSLVVPERVVPP